MKTKKIKVKSTLWDDEECTFFGTFHPRPFCEHCYDLPPYSITFSEGEYGVNYCMGCTQANTEIPQTVIDEVEKCELTYRKRFYESEIKKINKKLERM